MTTDAPPPPEAAAPHPKHRTKVGHFIEKYSTFLSSFVLGLAGLIATGIYQREQTKISLQQAEAQIKVSQNQAETSWKIARAEILSKNMQVLLNKDPGSIDQRYGVLLSLTREDVLDPELAMGYAFDLNNADYIKSVILNINHKSWAQIFHNFRLTCDLRYGVWRDAPVCKELDKLEPREQAMSDVVAEELNRGNKEPFKLLADTRQARGHLMRLVYLFEPYLRQAYERQRRSDIEAFEAQGPAAQLVAAFVLAADPSGELLGADEAAKRAAFHAARQKRLEKAVLEPSCEAECRGLAAELLLNGLPDYGTAYASVLRQVLEQRNETAQVLSRLHRRLLLCQADPKAVEILLRQVLLPAYEDLTRPPPLTPAAKKPDKDKAKDKVKNGKEKEKERARERMSEDVLDLLALIDIPNDVKLPEAAQRAIESRRPRIKKERESPPPTFKKLNFCSAKPEEESATTSEE